MNHSTRLAAGLATGILALGTGPTAAMAVPLSFTHAVHRHARHHGHSHSFNLKGLVTAANGTQLQVLVGQGHLGGQRLTGQSVQLDLNARGHHPSPDVGDSVHAQGTADSAMGEFDASQFEAQAAGDSSALVGVLDAVDGTTLMVNVSAAVGSDDQGDQGDGQGDQGDVTNRDDQGDDDVAIDASTASISLDGQPASVAQLTRGETVAILGETVDDSALATQVMAYSAVPGIVDGTITQVSGNVLTLSSGDSGGGGDGDGTSTVDVTGSQIFLDGQPGATVSQLAPGDDVLAIGTAGSDPLAATVTFAFDQGGDDQGGDGQGGDGQGD